MLSGVFAALLTPLSAGLTVDPRALCALTEFLLDHGIHGFYLCGSTGEGLLLDEGERHLVVETVVRQVRGRVPVVVHVGALSTAACTGLAAHARQAGADAVAAIPPFYYAVGREGILAHYRRISAAAGLPVYVYNIPSATQVSLGAALIRELMDEGAVQGVKYTSYDQLGFREIIENCGPRLNVMAGPDEMLLPFLIMGAHGGIGTTYNLAPELFVSLYDSWKAGDLAGARDLQYQIDRLILAIRDFGVVPAVKAAMSLRGIDCGQPRAPLMPLVGVERERLAEALCRLGLPGIGGQA